MSEIDMIDLKIPVDPKDPAGATIEDILGVLIRALNQNKMLCAGLILPTDVEVKTARVFGNNSRETIKKMFETGVRFMSNPQDEVASKEMGTKKVTN